MITLEYMVGCTVKTGLEVFGPCAVALAADLIVRVADPFHLRVGVRIGVSIMGNFIQDPLSQGLVAFPVRHNSVIKLSGRADLFVKDHIFDGCE